MQKALASRSIVPPRKLAKLEGALESDGYKFSTALEIRRALRRQDDLSRTLTVLRNQFTVKYGGPGISLQDDRLLLAHSWLQMSPGAKDIFDVWEGIGQNQPSIVALVASTLASLLTILSSHYTYHALGLAILKSLLSPPWMRRLNSGVGSASAELILASLKLLNSMSDFAGGQERKAVLESFAWETKSLPKLMHMRRKSKGGDNVDSLSRPDIRALFILFLLSFVDSKTALTVKTSFLEHHRHIFLSIFKTISQDSSSLVRKILEVCWEGIWSDVKLKRTLKIGLFNEITLSHLLKVYDRTAPDGTGSEDVPADIVHHFLLAICTRPGTGICFKDRAWYPRENTGMHEDDEQVAQSGKVYNKILANMLKNLQVNEDPRQQELALKVMAAAPELVASYWHTISLTLEPRLSSKWIANISFLGAVVSLPVPSWSFLLPGSGLYQPSPPPLSHVIDNVIPFSILKGHFTKGLQSTSPLVQHCTALALAKCLMKYDKLQAVFKDVINALDEDEEEGQWSGRAKDVEREIRRRVPDFQVIVAFAQSHTMESSFGDSMLLSESAHRLLWLYHRVLPAVAAEARFDIGKLLTSFSGATPEDERGASEPAVDSGLQIISRLHVLRLLVESDQFAWSSKIPSYNMSYMAVLLKIYIQAENPAIRETTNSLIQHLLRSSILFQEDPQEAEIWLSALPRGRRGSESESPDGALLTDEGDSVIVFLDDCMQRCLKTPYRYIEDRDSLADVPDEEGEVIESLGQPTLHSDLGPSPLLMTFVEQICAKVTHELLSHSDFLALVTFYRKLIFGLASKLQNLQILHAVTGKIKELPQATQIFPKHPVVIAAIHSEINITQHLLTHAHAVPDQLPGNEVVSVKEFLQNIEGLPRPTGLHARRISAYELVDWLRLLETPLDREQSFKVVTAIERLYQPALVETFQTTRLLGSLFTLAIELTDTFKFISVLNFGYVFVCSSASKLAVAPYRHFLLRLLFDEVPDVVVVRRATCLISHRLSRSSSESLLCRDLFLLLASIMKAARSVLSRENSDSLQEYIFRICSGVRAMCFLRALPETVEEAFREFVQASLDPLNNVHRGIVNDIVGHWSEHFRANFNTCSGTSCSIVSMWVGYAEETTLLSLLDLFCSHSSTFNDDKLLVLWALLQACEWNLTAFGVTPAFERRLPALLDLHRNLRQSEPLERMIALILDSRLPFCLDGFPVAFAESDSRMLSDWVLRGESQLRSFVPPEDELRLESFLSSGSWTQSTVQAVSALIYSGACSKRSFLDWLSSADCSDVSTKHLSRILYAFCDVCQIRGEQFGETDIEHLIPAARRLLRVVCDPRESRDDRTVCFLCVSLISDSADIRGLVRELVSNLPPGVITAEILQVGIEISRMSAALAQGVVTALVDQALAWAVRCFSDDSHSSETEAMVDLIGKLLDGCQDMKTHLVEPVFIAVVQGRMDSPCAFKLLAALAQVTQLKPVAVNRHLQSIIQHPQFFKNATQATSTVPALRDTIVEALEALFKSHPANTCQPSHIAPLVQIYGGTLSRADRKILGIFQLFESVRRTSVADLLARWSPSASPATTALEAVQGLDAGLLLRSSLHFPSWRCIAERAGEEHEHEPKHAGAAYESGLYDPVFVLLLLARMVYSSTPTAVPEWVQLFRTNVVGVAVRAMSSEDDRMREVALCLIFAIQKALENTDMQEKPHVVYIFNLLKDALPAPSSNAPTTFPSRLPSYTTLLLGHALRGVFHPAGPAYPRTARFLLQRPALDTRDVPLLLGSLFAGGAAWRGERAWMLRFLADGLGGVPGEGAEEDWAVFKGRRTWDMLASLFQSAEGDPALRDGILEVLANLTCSPHALPSLLRRSALLAWVEMQLTVLCARPGFRPEEARAWARILENVAVVADARRMDSGAGGAWRGAVHRCCTMLLGGGDPVITRDVLPLAARTVLRLALSDPRPSSSPYLPAFFAAAMSHFRTLEGGIPVPGAHAFHIPVASSPLHGASALHPAVALRAAPAREAGATGCVRAWGAALVPLWRLAMALPVRPAEWEGLTARLLVWRALVGNGGDVEGEGVGVGEWVRREVVRNLVA